MDGDGIAGVVGTDEVVIVADRTRVDSADIFRCLDLKTGDERWKLEYSAPSKLDYGNSPRAAPLIAGDMVFLLGASGHLHAVELSTGKVVWKTVLPKTFGGKMPFWGFSTSPLLIDCSHEGTKDTKDAELPKIPLCPSCLCEKQNLLTASKLIVPPGASDAGLVALDALSGNVVWKSDNGRTAGYASPLVTTFGNKPQIIFYDEKSLGGWDVATGKRLWELVPRYSGDFNVPTPIPLDGNRLFVITENNGARIYQFDEEGMIDPRPVAIQKEIGHDSNSAVASADRIYVVDSGLHCLDAADLKILWTLEDKAFSSYATLILGEDRLLIGTYSGEILLVDLTATPSKIVGRFCPFDEDDVLLSHPAVIGKYLIVRSTSEVVCVRFLF